MEPNLIPAPKTSSTNDTDLLNFYADAIAHETIRLDRKPAHTITHLDTAHLDFCERITDRIHLRILFKWAVDKNQGIRYAGCMGLQEYRDIISYESWN